MLIEIHELFHRQRKDFVRISKKTTYEDSYAHV